MNLSHQYFFLKENLQRKAKTVFSLCIKVNLSMGGRLFNNTY